LKIFTPRIHEYYSNEIRELKVRLFFGGFVANLIIKITKCFQIYLKENIEMHNEFTAIVEQDDNWYIAYCLDVPGANCQGYTKEECLDNLRDAIDLILEDQCLTVL